MRDDSHKPGGENYNPFGEEICPYCKEDTTFREWTFGENMGSIFSVGASFLAGGLFSKAKTAADFAVDAVSGGKWKNFICNSCDNKVHTCGGCGSYERYQDFGAKCSKCGYT